MTYTKRITISVNSQFLLQIRPSFRPEWLFLNAKPLATTAVCFVIGLFLQRSALSTIMRMMAM